MGKIRRALGVWMGFAVVLVSGLGQTVWAGSLHWRPLGPEGGWVVSLAAAPGQAGTAYAGMAGSGVWKTTDGARHWARLPMPPDPDAHYDDPAQYHVTLDPVDSRTIYVWTPGSLWSSRDGGAHWVRSTFSSPISAFAVAPSNPRVLYVAGTSPGTAVQPAPIYRSADRGATWRRTDTGPAVQPLALAVDPTDPRTVYFSGRSFDNVQPFGRVEVSHDGGATWTVLASLDLFGTKLVIQPGVHPVFFACSSLGVSDSSDGGRTWSTLLAASNSHCDVALDPSTTGTLYAVTYDFFTHGYWTSTLRRSRNGGATWETLQSVADKIDALAVDSRQPARLYTGLGRKGVQTSEDAGAHWTLQDTGLFATSIADVAADPAHPETLYSAVGTGIFRSGDGGTAWTATEMSANVLRLVASPANPTTVGTLYAGTNAGVFRSVDAGGIWELETLPMGEVHDLAIDPADHDRLYAAGTTSLLPGPPPFPMPTLAVSGDGGWTWVPPPQPFFAISFSLAIDPADPTHLYAGGDALLTSHDRGATWSTLWMPSFDPLVYSDVRKVVIDPNHPQTLFAAMEPWAAHKLVKSSDQGKTFAAIDAGLPWTAVRDLAIDPRSSVLYAATTRGVFVSRDGGASWAPDSSGLGAIPVVSLTFVPGSPNRLYAGTDGRGVFVTAVP